MMSTLRGAVARGSLEAFRRFARGQHDPSDFLDVMVTILHDRLNTRWESTPGAVVLYGGLPGAAMELPSWRQYISNNKSDIVQHMQVCTGS